MSVKNRKAMNRDCLEEIRIVKRNNNYVLKHFRFEGPDSCTDGSIHQNHRTVCGTRDWSSEYDLRLTST